MKIKNLAIIQARVGSTRLPGKVMLKIFNKTVLEHVVNRVKKSKKIDFVIVATTTNRLDSKISLLCKQKKIPVYRGDEEDVLDRYYQAAKIYQAENIIRITSDCPLIDPIIIDKVIRLHLKSGADYTTNTLKETYPDGEDVEVIKFATLKQAWERANLPSEREHVTPYIRKHSELFKIINLECEKNYCKKRWTLDNPEDFKFIIKIYENLYQKDHYFNVGKILRLLAQHPKLELINSYIKGNEGYAKSLKEDKK